MIVSARRALTPSANKFSPTTRLEIASAGAMAIQGAVIIQMRPSATERPQSGFGRRQAQPQEAQRADGESRIAHAQAGVNDDRAQAVGQDLAEHDVERRLAAQARGLDVFAVAHVEHQAAHQPRHARKAADR